MERIKQGVIRFALTAFLPLLVAPDISGQVTPPHEGPDIRGVNNRIRISASCASHGREQHLDVIVKGPPWENWITHLRPGEEGFWIKFSDASGNAVLAGYSIVPDTLTQTFHGRVKSIRGEEAIPLVPHEEYSVEVLQHPSTRGFSEPDKFAAYDRATFGVPFNCSQ